MQPAVTSAVFGDRGWCSHMSPRCRVLFAWRGAAACWVLFQTLQSWSRLRGFFFLHSPTFSFFLSEQDVLCLSQS